MVRRLGSRYELHEQIGGGGMAVVYRALDTMLGRTVAVKMLRPQFAGDEEFVMRFRQEAQSAARLSHPNIVNLYDVGVADSEYFIVMEYVDGKTLKDMIRDNGPLPIEESVRIAGQICDALEHAHDRHIIHRDVKPHNILIAKNGTVKVTDFGIARAITGNTITHHQTTSVLGSVHYFSPEQARGATTDIKSDIYSLGVVLYEMLTAELPFSGDSPVSVALKHLRERFVEPRVINPDIPQSVENIVLRCLVKAPEHRYSNMRAVKADLDDALIHPDVPKFVMPVEDFDETIAVPALSGSLSGTGSGVETPRKKRRVWLWASLWSVIGVGVLCIGAVAAYYIFASWIHPKYLNLPNVVNMPYAQARTRLIATGFQPAHIHEVQDYNGSKPNGVIYNQQPVGPIPVVRDRDIYLYVSKGPQQVVIPNLQGVQYDQAVQQLIVLGVAKENISRQSTPSDQVDTGSVVSTFPSANSSMPADGRIVVYVSSGPQIIVPLVSGDTLAEAESIIRSGHLKVGQVYQTQSQQPYGYVDHLDPTEGTQVPSGTPVDIYVSNNGGESGGALNNSAANNTTGNGGPPAPAGQNPATGAGGALAGGSTGNMTAGDNGQSNSGTNLPNSSNPPPSGGTNGSGTGQTSDQTTLGSDIHMETVDISVPDSTGKTLNVVIYKQDAETGPTKQDVFNASITKPISVPVPLYVTAQTNGSVYVYVNGVLQSHKSVQFDGTIK